MRAFSTIFVALLGLAFGSFLNVCLSRWPEGESVAAPRSHCRSCYRTLTWCENIPLFSWIALRGRCRSCRAWIGWRYPLVETLVAALWAFVAVRVLGSAPPELSLAFAAVQTLPLMVFTWLLVALAVLDAENFWLPDFLTISGVALGIFFKSLQVATLLPLSRQTGVPLPYGLGAQPLWMLGLALHWLLGIAIPMGLILLVRWLYRLLRKREGMGLGDAKLMAMLGAWLGLAGALQALVFGALLGTVVALVLLAMPRRPDQDPWALQRLPLGTFLCLGGMGSALWGEGILTAYLSWAGF